MYKRLINKPGSILDPKLINTQRDNRREIAENLIGLKKMSGEVYAMMPTILIRHRNKIVGAVGLDYKTNEFVLWEVCARPGYGRLTMLIVEKVVNDIFENKYENRFNAELPKSSEIELFCIEPGRKGKLHTFYQKCGYNQDQLKGQIYTKQIKVMPYELD